MPDEPDAPGGAPRPGGGGGPRVLGIPRTYLMVGAVALGGGLLYLWWQSTHASSSSTTNPGDATTGLTGDELAQLLQDWQGYGDTGGGAGGGSGGGDTGGSTSGTPGTVTGGGTSVPGPKPAQPDNPPKGKPGSVTYSSYTVKPGDTLASLAKRFGITTAQLAHSNVYVKGEAGGKTGQTLGTGAGLKTGQVLKVPHYGKG